MLYESKQSLDDGQRTLVDENLVDGESFVMAADMPGAIVPWAESVLVLTDERLLSLNTGLLRESLDTYQLNRLSAVESLASRKKMTIKGTGIEERFVIKGRDELKQFVQEVRNQLTETN